MRFMRSPAFAGQFYPKDAALLKHLLDGFDAKVDAGKIGGALDDRKVVAAVAPHAGIAYSGQTAAWTYKAAAMSHAEKKAGQTLVFFSPNHTGAGEMCSLSVDDWETPLGKAENNVKAGREMLAASKFLKMDDAAHAGEHSIEVQLPFAQYYFGANFSIVPITVMQGENFLDVAHDLADAVIAAEKKLEQKFLVIASSDFTHYEPAKLARQKDDEAIALIERLDYEKFFELVVTENRSICGFGPIVAAMVYAGKKGAKHGRLLHFSDSGEITKENDVVDYASIVFV